MAFNFDVEQAAQQAKRGSTPANPAKAANPVRYAKQISGISNFSKPAPWDYTVADLNEISQILRELAELEGWTDEELQARLWERDHMAPVNVRKALHALRLARNAALAPWPEKPAKRAVVTLCELVKAPKEFVVIAGNKKEAA